MLQFLKVALKTVCSHLHEVALQGLTKKVPGKTTKSHVYHKTIAVIMKDSSVAG